MLNQFSRFELLVGRDGVEKLAGCHVAVFGIGGVGGYVVEALVRSSIGKIDLIDNDTVALTNLNRQIIATHKTLGKYKVDVAKERILEINPSAEVNTFKLFYTPDAVFDFTKYDYIIDAIDTVSGKLSLIEKAKENNVPIICAMGAGNKMEASKFEVADIFETSVCPLARTMRTELKKRGIKGVKVVYSKEPPIKPAQSKETGPKKQIPGSNAFAPAVCGLIMANEVVKDLLKK